VLPSTNTSGLYLNRTVYESAPRHLLSRLGEFLVFLRCRGTTSWMWVQ